MCSYFTKEFEKELELPYKLVFLRLANPVLVISGNSLPKGARKLSVSHVLFDLFVL